MPGSLCTKNTFNLYRAYGEIWPAGWNATSLECHLMIESKQYLYPVGTCVYVCVCSNMVCPVYDMHTTCIQRCKSTAALQSYLLSNIDVYGSNHFNMTWGHEKQESRL